MTEEALSGHRLPMLLDAIRSLFKTPPESAPPSPSASSAGAPAPGAVAAPDPLHLAACVLLLEVAHSDGEFSEGERAHLEAVLARHFALSPEMGRSLARIAEEERRSSIDHYKFTSMLQQRYDLGQKMVLAEVMWGLVLSDGAISAHEQVMARKIANLLDLQPGYLSQAKASAARKAGTD